MSKTYSKCSDCGRMDYIGSGTACIPCERAAAQRAIRDSICPTYAVCEKCSRRFVCGNMTTTVCDTCDAEDFAKSLLRKADAEIARLTAELERVTKERDVAVRAIAGDADDTDCYLALVISLAMNSTHDLHPSHLENVLAATAKRKKDRDALAKRVRGLEGVVVAADELVQAYRDKFRDQRDPKLCTWGWVEKKKDAYDAAKSALTPPAPQQEKHTTNPEGGSREP